MAIFDGKRMVEKFEYKTVDTSTEKGLREAERLHCAGWKTIHTSFWSTQFGREIKTKGK